MPAFCCLNRHSARVGQQEFLFFGYILFCAFPVIGCAFGLYFPWRLCFQIVPPRWRLCFRIVLPLGGCAFRSCRPVGRGVFSSCRPVGGCTFGLYFPLAAVLSARAAPLAAALSDCASPLVEMFLARAALLAAVLSDCTSPWRLCFRIVLSRCQIYFQTAPHNKTCWRKVESREFVFSIRKSIGKSIRKSDSTTRSVRPILWTQAVAVAVHMYTSTAFSICRQHARLAQANRNHRTSIVQFTMQAPRKYRTLNVPPKCKRCANNALFADFSASFPCRICLFVQVIALSVAKTAKFYRFFTAIGFDAAGASPPVLS